MVKTINIENIPKEVHLILALLNSNMSINKELLTDIDWKLFLELCLHHRVYPNLHNSIRTRNLRDIPSAVIQFLSNHYQRNTFQMLHLTGEMERVSQWFSDQAVKLLFLKGPVLAKDLYHDISLRTSSDLDVMVPIDQLEKAEKILQQQGYIKDDYIETVLNDWRWRHHHVTYFHREKAIKIEVHWRLHPGPAKEPSFHDLWERKRQSELTNAPVYLLGKEDLFLFLTTHGARHGWSRLRWLVDIHQLSQQDLDWEFTRKVVKKYGYFQIAGQSIVLSNQLLHTPITNKMESLIKGNRASKLAQQAIFYLESMVNLHTDPVPEQVARYHKHHLFSLMSMEQKFFFILSFLFPYPEDAETLPLPKKLHFLYFPLRPILWMWRKTRKHALP